MSLADVMLERIGRVMYRRLLIVEGESARLCPVRFGFLRASRRTDAPVWSTVTRTVWCLIGYFIAYALWVHERTELRHTPPTQAKFLEAPLEASLDTLEREIADEGLRVIREMVPNAR